MIVTCCCTIFGGQNVCNMLYLTTKHVFENFGGGSCPVAGLMKAV